MTRTVTVIVEELETEFADEVRLCEHSGHHKYGTQHDKGPATHWVVAYHDCNGGGPEVYAACATWVQYVKDHQHQHWLCGCGYIDVGHRMAQVLQPV